MLIVEVKQGVGEERDWELLVCFGDDVVVFVEFFCWYCDYVYWVCCGLIGWVDVVEDVMQEVFLCIVVWYVSLIELVCLCMVFYGFVFNVVCEGWCKFVCEVLLVEEYVENLMVLCFVVDLCSDFFRFLLQLFE